MEKYFHSSFSYLHPDWIKEELGIVTGKNVKIAVIDSGISGLINDSRIKMGISFINPEDELLLDQTEDYFDTNGHGTGCTDLILRIALQADIFPIRVFGRTIESSINILEKAIYYAIEKEMQVINLSLGTNLPEALKPIYIACEEARQKNIIIVCAQSNSNNESYPAVFENVISVNTKQIDSHFDYIYNEDDVNEYTAKGFVEDVLGLNGERYFAAGNSFAAPNITGLVALYKEKFPDSSIEEVREFLNRNAVNSRIQIVSTI